MLDSTESLVKKGEDLLVLIKYLDRRYCYAYVPYGPKPEPVFENQGLFLEELSEAIRPHLPPQFLFIRYDFMWQNLRTTEDDYLASMFLVLSKKRGTNLYGASTSGQNNLMTSYALQWESIRLAKEHGCTEYNMFGSAPNLNHGHPLHGLHIYKKGFRGHLYYGMGYWDYPCNENI